jgi:hypothetical protein
MDDDDPSPPGIGVSIETPDGPETPPNPGEENSQEPAEA